MPTWLIWVIVIVVVLIVVGAVVSMMNKRRTEERRVRADELRTEASTKAASLTESQRQAEDARAKAELARSEAERAQEQATQAEQGHQVEQASYEDKLREADRLDPEVDHKSSDYEPSVWNDENSQSVSSPDSPAASTTAADGTSPRGSTGAHVAEPDATTPPTTDPAEGTRTRSTD